ncbi:MAG: hypothetical protein AAFY65_05130 [Pseudomonadota bacterium]
MAVPYALALIVLELIQVLAFLLHQVGLKVYGPFFMIGYVGTLLILVASVKAIRPRADWLSCLPLAFVAFAGGTYFPPFVLPLAAIYLLVRLLK